MKHDNRKDTSTTMKHEKKGKTKLYVKSCISSQKKKKLRKRNGLTERQIIQTNEQEYGLKYLG